MPVAMDGSVWIASLHVASSSTDLSSLRDSGSHSGKGLVADLRSLNHSLLRMESTYELSHQQMELTMDGLFNRMAVLETTRQDGAVSNGMEQLYKEVNA